MMMMMMMVMMVMMMMMMTMMVMGVMTWPNGNDVADMLVVGHVYPAPPYIWFIKFTPTSKELKLDVPADTVRFG